MHPSHSLPLSATFPAHTHTCLHTLNQTPLAAHLSSLFHSIHRNALAGLPQPPSVWRPPSLWAHADLLDIPLIYGSYIICSNIIHRATACLLVSLSGAITDNGYSPEDGTGREGRRMYDTCAFNWWMGYTDAEADYKEKSIRVDVCVWVGARDYIHTRVIEAGRREEEMMGGFRGWLSRRERIGWIEDSHEKPSKGLKGLWKGCVGGKMAEEGEKVILESQMEEEQARQNMTQLYITVLSDGRYEKLKWLRHPPSTSATSPPLLAALGVCFPQYRISAPNKVNELLDWQFKILNSRLKVDIC